MSPKLIRKLLSLFFAITNWDRERSLVGNTQDESLICVLWLPLSHMLLQLPLRVTPVISVIGNH